MRSLFDRIHQGFGKTVGFLQDEYSIPDIHHYGPMPPGESIPDPTMDFSKISRNQASRITRALDEAGPVSRNLLFGRFMPQGKAKAAMIAGLGVAGLGYGVNQAYGYFGLPDGMSLGGLAAGGAAVVGGGLIATRFLARNSMKIAPLMGKAGLKLAGSSVNLAAAGFTGVAGAAMALERMARFTLTGSPLSMLSGGKSEFQSFSDAWLPNARVLPNNDIRKYALNPSVIKRVVGGRAAMAVVSGLHELANPKVKDPTIFFDGVNIRSKGDMGAHGGYGQNILQNSIGMDTATMSRMLAHMI